MERYRDPLAPHISEGETAEEVDAEQQRLLREQLEADLMQGTDKFRRRVRKNSGTSSEDR